MDESAEKAMLIGEIVVLRATLCQARGLPLDMLGKGDELQSYTVEELRAIEKRLMDLCRSAGGVKS